MAAAFVVAPAVPRGPRPTTVVVAGLLVTAAAARPAIFVVADSAAARAVARLAAVLARLALPVSPWAGGRTTSARPLAARRWDRVVGDELGGGRLHGAV